MIANPMLPFMIGSVEDTNLMMVKHGKSTKQAFGHLSHLNYMCFMDASDVNTCLLTLIPLSLGTKLLAVDNPFLVMSQYVAYPDNLSSPPSKVR